MINKLLDPVALGASVAVLVAGIVLVTHWDPISAGHPSYLVFYFGVIVTGAVTLVAILRRDTSRRRLSSVLGAGGLLVLGLAAWWLAPFPADTIALEALSNPDGIEVRESPTSIQLEPSGERSGTALTFYPGARVDARAYARILTPIALAGHEVIIVKPPLGIAFLVFGVTRPEEATRWALAGHSLGGVAASAAVDPESDGLLLWASYPASNLSGAADLMASSIYGTADTFTTPDDIASSEPNLPSSTAFVPIPGGIHSFFGDYGSQPGDGVPTISRDEAQDLIVAASLELVESLGGE
ncbi:MAG: alpha/beta hydrolase [Acidimicrobiia bacterium]|jgi:hypothetical protein